MGLIIINGINSLPKRVAPLRILTTPTKGLKAY
jgi:hypothetical protein